MRLYRLEHAGRVRWFPYLADVETAFDELGDKPELIERGPLRLHEVIVPATILPVRMAAFLNNLGNLTELRNVCEMREIHEVEL